MSSGKVVVITDAEFDSSVLQSDKLVVLDFWAEWCQPCKMLSPTVEEIAGEYEDTIKVGKLNVDDNPNTATKYGIRGIPTLLFFKGGQVVQQLVGVKSKSEIKKIIDDLFQYLSKNSKRYIKNGFFKNQTKERVIADFIAGMTDRYAINLHKKIK